MSAKDAAYRLAHAYKGGVAALAARMGMNPHSLQNKVNPNEPAHLYVEDAELMTALSEDPQIAQALAFACNHVCIPVAPGAARGALGPEIAAVGEEFGGLMRATQEAIRDERVTPRELAEYDRRFQEFLSAAVTLRHELVRMIPMPPAAPLKVAK